MEEENEAEIFGKCHLILILIKDRIQCVNRRTKSIGSPYFTNIFFN